MYATLLLERCAKHRNDENNDILHYDNAMIKGFVKFSSLPVALSPPRPFATAR